MIWNDLTSAIKTTHFTNYQVQRLFAGESSQQVNTQLWRWSQQGKLIRLKQGLYVFAGANLEEFTISSFLYQPSYVTAESVLNAVGVIPDIPLSTVAVTPRTTKMYENHFGNFAYHKISSKLFFGYHVQQDANGVEHYKIAQPEKALLDYLYLRKISELADTRIDGSSFDQNLLAGYAAHYPKWVQRAAVEIKS
ncbi:MAG: hypothetical protein XD95_0112 [Microgenomates bacterium 39_7]|nr:MAG: hypothetical protein XD95_0112 [Microgenomates bacterium 39_7]